MLGGIDADDDAIQVPKQKKQLTCCSFFAQLIHNLLDTSFSTRRGNCIAYTNPAVLYRI